VQVSQILTEIDNEIARLQQARNLLAGGGDHSAVRNAGRSSSPAVKGPRKLSAEGRQKIADAMKRRWMERKKQAAVKGGKNEKSASPKAK
jgi:hypothetical protein